MEGRNFLAVELNKRYAAIAEARIKKWRDEQAEFIFGSPESPDNSLCKADRAR